MSDKPNIKVLKHGAYYCNYGCSSSCPECNSNNLGINDIISSPQGGYVYYTCKSCLCEFEVHREENNVSK